MKITIIGSGNVATHLAIRLKDIGEEIVEVYSPHSSHAESLAQKAGCKAVTSTDEIFYKGRRTARSGKTGGGTHRKVAQTYLCTYSWKRSDERL